MLISEQALCMLWKTTQVSVLQGHLLEKKIQKLNKKQTDKSKYGYNCPMLNAYDVVPKV